jgi:hypothetical protein
LVTLSISQLTTGFMGTNCGCMASIEIIFLNVPFSALRV